jgi:hypothetical protein
MNILITIKYIPNLFIYHGLSQKQKMKINILKFSYTYIMFKVQRFLEIIKFFT